ncbi:MAG: 50S ribosomal protein L11 methyltransferase [Planctomycetes bacterium]|nr:50S ribosomal protein L11 methyltransferase [Planctomycetota bacterium]
MPSYLGKLPMKWFRIRLTVPAATAEDASAEFAALGASGVKIEDGDPAVLESHFEGDVAEGARGVAAAFGGKVESAEWVEEEDWMEAWKKRSPAVLVGRFCIHPSHEPPRWGMLNLRIDPGTAFGTGDHPTTRLMLLEIEAMAAARPLGRFLDLGCGTGILAMAAALLGAREVVAADVDRRALDVARDNARANGLEGKIKFVEGSIGKCPGRYEEIAANLTPDLHLARFREYRKKLVSGGRLRMGGIKEDEAAGTAGAVEGVEARRGEGWVVLRGADEAAWVASAAPVVAPPPEPAKSPDPPTLVLSGPVEEKAPAAPKKRGAIHHLDLNVGNLDESKLFYGRLLPRFGYEKGEAGEGWASWKSGDFYITLVQAQDPWRADGYHRKCIGVNHLAFAAPSRDAVEALHEWLMWESIPVLYSGPMEMGGEGKENYAVFFEDPDRLKLEYVYRP